MSSDEALSKEDEELLARLEADADALMKARDEIEESEDFKRTVAAIAEVAFLALRPLLTSVSGAYGGPVAAAISERASEAVAKKIHELVIKGE